MNINKLFDEAEENFRIEWEKLKTTLKVAGITTLIGGSLLVGAKIINPNSPMNQIFRDGMGGNSQHSKQTTSERKNSGSLEVIVEKPGISFEKTEKNISNDLKLYAKYIEPYEGRRAEVYCAINPREKNRENFEEPTIGVGHFMDRGDSREVFEKVLPEVNYNAVLSGREKLTPEQIDRLFEYDLQIHVERTKRLFPAFDSYSLDLCKALLDGVYRGDLSASPKTIRLINHGEFVKASKEYLNHKEYENARRNNYSGVAKRMEENSHAMRMYGVELKGRN